MEPDHVELYARFARAELAAGGPDPQLALVDSMSEGCPVEEKAWRIGCYCAFHAVPSAEAVWRDWSGLSAQEAELHDLESWCVENWAGLTFRTERRCVRTPKKLARFLKTYASWATGITDRPWMQPGGDPRVNYDLAWDDVTSVWNLGRYIGLKHLEFMGRYCGANIELYDIRPRGGWSPRETLSKMLPEFAPALLGSDTPSHLTVANRVARKVRADLALYHDLNLDWYPYQVFLCEFKESYWSRRYYPGRSHDEELVILDKIASHWAEDTHLLTHRAKLFPAQVLGEQQGWWGDRKRQLGTLISDHQLVWSDLCYDYNRTLLSGDFSNPILRAA